MIREPKGAVICPPLSEIKPVANSQLIREKRNYKIITALYGGGVEPNYADPITIVRATEIRGHLRFWWRACRAAGFTDVKALKEQEGKIWGSTETPSEVTVACSIINAGQPEIAYSVGPNPNNGRPRLQESAKLPKYASFPLQPDKTELNQIGWKSEAVLLNVSFELELTYCDKWKSEVEAALWAWETFGGIGARTRRGFGALKCTNPEHDQPANIGSARKSIEESLKKYVSTGSGNPKVPKLNPTMTIKLVNANGGADRIWLELIDKLNRFRQMRFGTKYGMSQWPEANAIRGLNHRKLKSPKSPSGAPTSPINVSKFPRAAFGLPIIFHLPHDRLDDASLEGTDYDRLASPLILRPLLCGDGKALGLAAVLDAPSTPPKGLSLNQKGKSAVRSDLTSAEAKMIPPLKGNTDVLAAFLNTL